MRPLVRRGEQLLALTFGLVHGLAFAGILTTLGLDGSLSALSLLAFNPGVELAQLTAVVLLLPSRYALSRTTWSTGARCLCAGSALAASAGWVLDRLGGLPNPLTELEAGVVEHLWLAPTTAAAAALTAMLAGRARAEDVGRSGPVIQQADLPTRAGPLPQPSQGTTASVSFTGTLERTARAQPSCSHCRQSTCGVTVTRTGLEARLLIVEDEANILELRSSRSPASCAASPATRRVQCRPWPADHGPDAASAGTTRPCCCAQSQVRPARPPRRPDAARDGGHPRATSSGSDAASRPDGHRPRPSAG